ncbi:hypothetical protein QI230_02880 [Staphylococcus saprophyticus]|nr:hypothetical protein [Staphylococcus saprophyticus]
MAYEYEKENIRKLNSYNVLSGGSNITKPIKELHEVYRKAKAFNELVELYPQKEEIPSDEFFDLMGYIIKERADDER